MKRPSLPEGMALAGADLVAGLIDGMLDAVLLVDAATARVVAANGWSGWVDGRMLVAFGPR